MEPTPPVPPTHTIVRIVDGIFNKARIRQFIAVTLTGLIGYETVITNNIDAITLIGVYGTVLGFYFGDQKE